MSFENLSIGRLIIHEVFARGADRALVQPTYGNQLLVLPQDARDALQARITNALGKSSHGVEMTIRESGADSTWHRAKEIVEAQGNDAQFVNISQNIASKLAVAQANRTIPGGIVVVIEGTCGNPAKSFMCVIKAEPHGGFTKRQAGGHMTLEYIKELILTPQAKLYKIGAFLQQDPAGTYVSMDFSTRDAYRHVVEKVARLSGATEIDVATAVLELAKAHPDTRTLQAHVGYYLVDDGIPDLRAAVAALPGAQKPVRLRPRRVPLPAYLLPIGLIALGFTYVLVAQASAGRFSWGWLSLIAVLGLIAFSTRSCGTCDQPVSCSRIAGSTTPGSAVPPSGTPTIARAMSTSRSGCRWPSRSPRPHR